eukprot:m.879756 g.879756  ORF g.879756 m.879756 type:complete len:82 (-) comp59845_c0_seq2:965-1210(-)
MTCSLRSIGFHAARWSNYDKGFPIGVLNPDVCRLPWLANPRIVKIELVYRKVGLNSWLNAKNAHPESMNDLRDVIVQGSDP